MDGMLDRVLKCLNEVNKKVGTFQAFVGFDGYMDTLVRPVRTMSENGDKIFFETISDFGGYLQGKAAKSCSVELYKVAEKAGGNAAIFSRAISGMGVKTTCVGTFGYPKALKAFETGSDSLQLISVSEPGYCMALEFQDGKVMLSENGGINDMDYALVAARIGEKNLRRMFEESDVIALMNWSEVPGCTDIWRGLSERILPNVENCSQKKLFVDISDCSRRSKTDIRNMFSLLKGFAEKCKVTLSLNQNEFDRVADVLSLREKSLTETGKGILQESGLECLVLHQMDGAMAFTQGTVVSVPNHRVANPVISTGGGDNFNAGFVFGMMSGMDLQESLYFANAVGSYYVSHGKNPTLENMKEYIGRWKKAETVENGTHLREVQRNEIGEGEKAV